MNAETHSFSPLHLHVGVKKWIKTSHAILPTNLTINSYSNQCSFTYWTFRSSQVLPNWVLIMLPASWIPLSYSLTAGRESSPISSCNLETTLKVSLKSGFESAELVSLLSDFRVAPGTSQNKSQWLNLFNKGIWKVKTSNHNSLG